jgi:hypothetical protein
MDILPIETELAIAPFFMYPELDIAPMLCGVGEH